MKTLRFIPTCGNQCRSEGKCYTVRDLSHGRGKIVIALRSLKLEVVSIYIEVLCSVGVRGAC